MQIISTEIETFYTNEEMDNGTYQANRDKLEAEGYKHKDGYNAVYQCVKGYVETMIK